MRLSFGICDVVCTSILATHIIMTQMFIGFVRACLQYIEATDLVCINHTLRIDLGESTDQVRHIFRNIVISITYDCVIGLTACEDLLVKIVHIRIMLIWIRTSPRVPDGFRVEIHTIDRASTLEHPEVVLLDDLEIDEMDVDGMREASIGVNKEPILDVANFRVLTLARMEVCTTMNSQHAVCLK